MSLVVSYFSSVDNDLHIFSFELSFWARVSTTGTCSSRSVL